MVRDSRSLVALTPFASGVLQEMAPAVQSDSHIEKSLGLFPGNYCTLSPRDFSFGLKSLGLALTVSAISFENPCSGEIPQISKLKRSFDPRARVSYTNSLSMIDATSCPSRLGSIARFAKNLIGRVSTGLGSPSRFVAMGCESLEDSLGPDGPSGSHSNSSAWIASRLTYSPPAKSPTSKGSLACTPE